MKPSIVYRNILASILACLFQVGIQSVLAQGVSLDWAISLGDTFHDVAYSVTVDPLGNVYTTGFYKGTADFNPGPGTDFHTSVNNTDDAFIQKVDSNGKFIWAKTFGGNSYSGGQKIIYDSNGYLYLSGNYYGTVDFDPGLGTTNLTSLSNSRNVFITKFDTAGNFIWARSIGGSLNDWNGSMIIGDSQFVYVTGSFEGLADFDPGPATYNLTANSNSNDVFVLKLDSNGNFVWAKSFGSKNSDSGSSITTDLSGNVYTTGDFRDTTDFDPGAATFNLIPNGPADIFIQKLDPNGNFVWAKSIGGINNEWGTSIHLDKFNSLYLTGFFVDTMDFDPGPGIFNMIAKGQGDIFIQKLDDNGNFIWAKAMGGTGDERGLSIVTDSAGNVYATGEFKGITDFDPSASIFNLNSGFFRDVFVVKLDKQGNFNWAKSMGGWYGDYGNDITVDEKANVYVTGAFIDTADFDPGPAVYNLVSTGVLDCFTFKLSQDSCANLALVFDSVTNINCIDSGYAFAHAINGTPPYFYQWNTTPVNYDSFAVFDSSGIYTLTVTAANSCTFSTSILVNAPPIGSVFDLNANLITSGFVSGQSSCVLLDAFNNACRDTSGQLILILDSLVTYNSASINPNQVNGDTLIWNFGNMNYDSTHFVPKVYLTTDTGAVIGDTICFTVIINPILGDLNPTNNVKQYCFQVLASFDPNDKQVYPQGVCPQRYILKNETLSYTIQFQNTGTTDAINIHIIDSLNLHFDLSTAKVISSSHPMYTEVLPGNVLNFVFNNINLPDSGSNEAASHGYVIFEINHYSGLPDGEQIENKSEIYFDFNPPVITNTVSNILFDVLPICLVERVPSVKSKERIIPFPNPATTHFQLSNNFNGTIALYNTLGQSVLQRTIKPNERVEVTELKRGIYFYKLSGQPLNAANEKTHYGKLIID